MNICSGGQKMKIGYARVSTSDQNLDLQNKALKEAGCERIFEDVASGARSERPGLNEALNFMRPGDILVVWKLDRLGRSLKHLIDIVNDLKKKEIGFISLQENIDTTSKIGMFFFHVFGALAEFEKDIIIERTNAGLAAARARGRNGGRPRKVKKSDIPLIQAAVKASMKPALNKEDQITITQICEKYSISRTTFYRTFNPDGTLRRAN